MYAQHHPNPMRYNPYAHNPLTRGQKIAIGVGAAFVVGGVAYLLWPSSASAATPLPDVGPSTGGGSKRPTGSPPPIGGACMPPEYGGSNAYDTSFWQSGDVGRQQILDAFSSLGYATPAGRMTMNDPGPDGILGSAAKDDVPNPEVTRFQKNYNAVSRWGQFAANMRGLDTDGKVGPCTLNGMQLVLNNLAGLQWPQVVQAAAVDGYK